LEVIERSRERPDQFESYQRAHCCVAPEKWTRGRGDIALDRAIEHLSIGEIGSEPLSIENQYVIVRRLDPSVVPASPEVSFVLPAPSQPDMESVFGQNDGTLLTAKVRLLREDINAGLALERADKLKLDSILISLENDVAIANTAELRVSARRKALESVRSEFKAEASRSISTFVEDWVRKDVLAGAR
jgi:hypothetical protein